MRYRFIIVLAVVAVIAGAMGVAPAASAPNQPPLNVTVVNPLTSPVPVTTTTPVKIDPAGNTVKVDPTGNTVKIDPAGSTVKLDPTGNAVTVDSAANSPVHTQEAKTPVVLFAYHPSAVGEITAQMDFRTTFDVNQYVVPAGKTLVITSLDVFGEVKPGETARWAWVDADYAQSGGGFAQYILFMKMNLVGTSAPPTLTVYESHRDCEIYVPEGSGLSASYALDSGAGGVGTITTQAQITGYLVSSP